MSDTITLVCPSCGGKTSFKHDINRVICQYCGNEHVFQLDQPTALKPMEWFRARPRQPQPRNVRLRKEGRSLELTWRWFSVKYVPLAFFCIAWDSFLIFWYGMAFSSNAPWIFKVFPIAHLAVGVGLTYATLAGFLNTTSVRLNEREFTVQHDPVPWGGEVRQPIGDVKQLYCRLKEPKTSESSASYELAAVLKNGREINLLPNLDSPDIGLFMEQQIESWLRISDAPVGNELPR
jgi:hypothetical protein